MTQAEIELMQAAIAAIETIIATVRNARAGKVDPGVALTAIATMHASLQQNNAAADSALDAKFPPGHE